MIGAGEAGEMIWPKVILGEGTRVEGEFEKVKVESFGQCGALSICTNGESGVSR